MYNVALYIDTNNMYDQWTMIVAIQVTYEHFLILYLLCDNRNIKVMFINY